MIGSSQIQWEIHHDHTVTQQVYVFFSPTQEVYVKLLQSWMKIKLYQV